MLIGINYNTDGTRYIALLVYNIANTTKDLSSHYANIFKDDFDELYICDTFNPNYKPLIQDIVLNSCRIS